MTTPSSEAETNGSANAANNPSPDEKSPAHFTFSLEVENKNEASSALPTIFGFQVLFNWSCDKEKNEVKHRIELLNPSFIYPLDTNARVSGTLHVHPYSDRRETSNFECSTQTEPSLVFEETVQMERLEIGTLDTLKVVIVLKSAFGILLEGKNKLHIRSMYTDFHFLVHGVPLYASKCELSALSHKFAQLFQNNTNMEQLVDDESEYIHFSNFLNYILYNGTVGNRGALLKLCKKYAVYEKQRVLEDAEALTKSCIKASFCLADELDLPYLRKKLISTEPQCSLLLKEFMPPSRTEIGIESCKALIAYTTYFYDTRPIDTCDLNENGARTAWRTVLSNLNEIVKKLRNEAFEIVLGNNPDTDSNVAFTAGCVDVILKCRAKNNKKEKEEEVTLLEHQSKIQERFNSCGLTAWEKQCLEAMGADHRANPRPGGLDFDAAFEKALNFKPRVQIDPVPEIIQDPPQSSHEGSDDSDGEVVEVEVEEEEVPQFAPSYQPIVRNTQPIRQGPSGQLQSLQQPLSQFAVSYPPMSRYSAPPSIMPLQPQALPPLPPAIVNFPPYDIDFDSSQLCCPPPPVQSSVPQQSSSSYGPAPPLQPRQTTPTYGPGPSVQPSGQRPSTSTQNGSQRYQPYPDPRVMRQ